MTVTLKVDEATPEDWPASPTGLSTAAAAIAPGVVWGRIEQWIAWRWSARAVVFTAEGPGDWEPPLRPFTVATVEAWRSEAWEAVTLRASPLGGFVIEGAGPYRIAGVAGSDDDDVPADVLEAYTRLAEYMASPRSRYAGASTENLQIGEIERSATRSPAWLARALANSGAGDLLRKYRRA